MKNNVLKNFNSAKKHLKRVVSAGGVYGGIAIDKAKEAAIEKKDTLIRQNKESKYKDKACEVLKESIVTLTNYSENEEGLIKEEAHRIILFLEETIEFTNQVNLEVVRDKSNSFFDVISERAVKRYDEKNMKAQADNLLLNAIYKITEDALVDYCDALKNE